MHKHPSALGVATTLKPAAPVTLIRPEAAARAARFFAEKGAVTLNSGAMAENAGSLKVQQRLGADTNQKSLPRIFTRGSWLAFSLSIDTMRGKIWR